MLKYIKIRNFLSFKEEKEINFESSNYGWKSENVFNIKSLWKKTTFSKSMLIYWANSSWKSNILKAIDLIKFIATSTDNKKLSFILSPFLLDCKSQEKTIFLEICFFIENKEYIYNFELFDNKFVSENLIEVKTKWKVSLYERKLQKMKFDKSFVKESKKWFEKMKEDVSFFAVLSQWNWILNKKPIDHFFSKLNIIFDNDIWPGLTIWLLDLVKSDENKKIVIEFLRCADINISDIKITKKILPQELLDRLIDAPKEFINDLSIKIEFWHKRSDSDEIIYLPIESESDGTQKLFYILWPIIDSILNERILFIDEIETNLHPHILKNLFKLIHTKIDKKYQFIFTTHNIELMDLSMFKKEQIWIVSKNKENFSNFYTLYDFDDIPLRSEKDIRKLYNLWSLWWVPSVGDFSILLDDIKLNEEKTEMMNN